jgi:hypothetical protein
VQDKKIPVLDVDVEGMLDIRAKIEENQKYTS